MSNLMFKFPHNWGVNSLSKFQDHAFKNEVAAFRDMVEHTSLVGGIDSAFHDFSNHVMNNLKDDLTTTALLMMINAHNHFRASARLCLSGQCISTYATGRACLETAVYGWYLLSEPSLVDYWRSKPAASQRDDIKAWYRTFKYSTIAKKVGKQADVLEGLLKNLHQTAIDFGAHPNKEALYSNLSVEEHPKGKLITLTHLHVDGALFNHTFNFLIDIGLTTLVLIKLACPSISTAIDLENKLSTLNNAAKKMRFSNPPN